MTTAAKKKPPGRRKSESSYDALLQVRMRSEQKAKLMDEAKRRDMDASELVRRQLGALIGVDSPAPPESPVETESRPAEPRDGETGALDFAAWLGGRMRLPRALALRYVKAGRVKLAQTGEPWTEEMIDRQALAGGILFDGNLL